MVDCGISHPLLEQSEDFTRYSHNNVMVELEWIGEGWFGDYEPNNPEDDPLLRFTVYRWDGSEWLDCDSGSYCTTLVVKDTTLGARSEFCKHIHKTVQKAVRGGLSIRKACQELSHWRPKKYKKRSG